MSISRSLQLLSMLPTWPKGLRRCDESYRFWDGKIILDCLGKPSLIICILPSGEPFLTGSKSWDGRRKGRDLKKRDDRLDWPLLTLKREEGDHESIQQHLEIGNHSQFTHSKEMVTLVLQLQGTELRQQCERGKKSFSPRASKRNSASALILVCWRFY